MYLVRRLCIEVNPKQTDNPLIQETIWVGLDLYREIQNAKRQLIDDSNRYVHILPDETLLRTRGLVFKGISEGKLGEEYHNVIYRNEFEIYNLEAACNNNMVDHFIHPFRYEDMLTASNLSC